MGVPKFYRWISERYPQINQVITDSALLPEFDHLYLDMNGIIHGCTHPSHMDISATSLSEKEMMLGIMHYIDRIVSQIVKPKISVFMAIDGVAPRAKLNQQRSRRFRSAKDLAEATKDKQTFTTNDDGAVTTNILNVFDSNCITPGTEFMARVSNTIQYFIRKKLKEDPSWKKLKVIFSGHEIPGEGEHKIMDHIRDMRNQPDYQPNTRHCMYGQDADLIMLGLVSHEPHFTLLREIVDFGHGFASNKNALKAVKKFTKQSDFQLLHLSILREYLAYEFGNGLSPNSFDLEATIDDWIFLTFLVGNDFLPHMPTLDIGDGAFELLFDTYKEQRLTWGDGEYLTRRGEISNASRLEAFFSVIGAAEVEILLKREESEADYTKKKRRWDKRDGKSPGPSDKEIAANEKALQLDFVSMIENMMKEHGEDATFVEGWELPTDPTRKDLKGRYYYEKLNFTPIDIEEHKAMRQSYIEGLIWCLAYYYRGCISWGWFYPYHYGPMLSDLTDLTRVFDSISFEVGSPLRPFEQLMGCLPPASADLVPRPYRKLMTSPESPIIQFYPQSFEVDMNGKKNPWEGVNILPFIDVNILRETIAKFCPDKVLTADEINRNSIGKVLCYSYDPVITETVQSCNRDIGLSDIINCQSRVTSFDFYDRNNIPFKPTLIPGTKLPLPGFPSLNVLPIKFSELIPIGLNCFGSPSKYPTKVLTLQELPKLPGAAELADNILGKSLYINWPMMHEAKVSAISDGKCIVRMVGKKKKVHNFNSFESDSWYHESNIMKEHYMVGSGSPGMGGVRIGEIQIRLKMLPLQGMKVSRTDGSQKKVFGTKEADVPLQMALWKSPAPDPRFENKGPLKLKDRFPTKCNVILTKGKFRGCIGSVLCVDNKDKKVGVKVKVIPPEPPFGLAIARMIKESYISSRDAAKILGIHPSIFGKICGSLLFNPGRFDLGLNLKYQKEFCVLGYSRKVVSSEVKEETKVWGSDDTLLVIGNNSTSSDEEKDEKVTWEYTANTIRLIRNYQNKFPVLFSAISKKPNERTYDAKILGKEGLQVLQEIRDWLNQTETANLPRSPCTTEAMPVSAIRAVQRAADVRVAAARDESREKESNVKIPPSALILEGAIKATEVIHSSEYNDSLAPELGDRIANICANGVPFGSRGTVVGVHDSQTRCVEVVMDEEFIGGSTLQGTCSNFRGKLCLWNHLLRISASDSAKVVDTMIPTGSTMNEHETFMKNQKSSTVVNVKQSHDKNVSKPKEECTKHVENKSVTKICKKTAQSSNENNSNLRGGRQGAWREAKGPDQSGIGFKGAGRGGKSGLQAWRDLIQSNGPSGSCKVDSTTGTDQNGHPTGASANFQVNKIQQDPVSDVSEGLKALLGVKPSDIPKPHNDPSLQTTKPTSAADALFKLMIQNESEKVPPPQYPMQTPQPVFNFNYVKDGETNPPIDIKHQSQPIPHIMYPMPASPMVYYHGTMPPPMVISNVAPHVESHATSIPQGERRKS